MAVQGLLLRAVLTPLGDRAVRRDAGPGDPGRRRGRLGEDRVVRRAGRGELRREDQHVPDERAVHRGGAGQRRRDPSMKEAVLGGGGGQRLWDAVGVGLKEVEEEAGRPPGHRPEPVERLVVHRAEAPLLVELAHQPRPAHRPLRPGGVPVRGEGEGPGIGVVVGHPAPGAVEPSGSVHAPLGEPLEQREQRAVGVGGTGGLGAPVVHRQVDVERVGGRPRRLQLGVPDPLEVGREPAVAAGTQQQVSAVLEEQRHQRRVRCRHVRQRGRPDPLARVGLRPGVAEAHGEGPRPLGVRGRMPGEGGLRGRLGATGRPDERLAHWLWGQGGGGVGGLDREDDPGRGGGAHQQRPAVCGHLPVGGHAHPYSHTGRFDAGHLPGEGWGVRLVAGGDVRRQRREHRHRAGGRLTRFDPQRCGHADAEIARLIRSDGVGEDVVAQAGGGAHLPGASAVGEGRGVDAGGEVQGTHDGGVGGTVDAHLQLADGQERLRVSVLERTQRLLGPERVVAFDEGA